MLQDGRFGVPLSMRDSNYQASKISPLKKERWHCLTLALITDNDFIALEKYIFSNWLADSNLWIH